MPRATLPVVIALVGILGAAGLALTTYTQPIDGAASDPELYNLLAAAVGEPPLGSRPAHGSSPLPITRLAPPDSGAQPGPAPSVTSSSPQPRLWATRGAAIDSTAMRAWLGPWVVATERVKAPDTILLTLHRLTLHRHCPLFSTLTASFVASYGGTPRLAHLRATCPAVPPRQ